MLAGGHLLPARGRHAATCSPTATRRRAGRSSTTASRVARRGAKPVIAHQLPQLHARRQGRATRTSSDYVGYQPPINAHRRRRSSSTTRSLPPNLRDGRRHARGLRERQRLPDAHGRGPAALGPRLGEVPRRAEWRSRWIWRAAGRARPASGWRSSSSSRSTRSSASAWATSRRCSSRSRTGTRWTGTSATSRRRSRTVAARRRDVGRLRAHDPLRRRRDGALAGDRLPGRLLRRAPRRALARADPRPARPAVLDLATSCGCSRGRTCSRPTATRRAALHALSIDTLFSKLGLLDGNDWLGGQHDHRDPRARLRLRAVLHPAALRVAGPPRPAADRGRARPRRLAAPAPSGACPAALAGRACSPASC